VADRPLRATVLEHVRKVLMRSEMRGEVRKIVVEPEVWWELVE